MQRMPYYRVRLVQALRQRQTETEEILWAQLRARRCAGLKFRRQHPLGRYVADFYCEAARLVVEVDGSVHEEQDRKDYDAVREAMLIAYECVVLHFTTDEVLTQLPAVVERIRQVAAERSTLTPR